MYQAYSEAVKDKQVNSGGLMRSWNPLSHCSYETNEIVTTIAESLHDILKRIK